jgi:hypothetical protein
MASPIPLAPPEVAAIVGGLLKEPAEHPRRVGGIGDTGGTKPPEDARHVLLRRDPPVGVPRRRLPPPLDPGEQPFSTRPVRRHLVGALGAWCGEVRGNQILRATQLEDVALVGVTRQSLVGSAGDRRQIQRPAETERPVAAAGVVSQGQYRFGAAARSGECERHGECRGSGQRVGRELLPHGPDRPACFRQRQGGMVRPFVLARVPSGVPDPPRCLGVPHLRLSRPSWLGTVFAHGRLCAHARSPVQLRGTRPGSKPAAPGIRSPGELAPAASAEHALVRKLS